MSLQFLVSQKRVLKSKLTRLNNKFIKISTNEFVSDQEVKELKNRLNDDRFILKQFEEIFNKIVEVSKDPVDESEFESFDEEYYKVVSNIEVFLEKATSSKNKEIQPSASKPSSE